MPGDSLQKLLIGGVISALVVWMLSQWNEKAAWLYVLLTIIIVMVAFRGRFFPQLNRVIGQLRV